MLAKAGGRGAGLPFFAFLDANEQTIVTSRIGAGGKNIGYPYQPEEIGWFVAMMKKAVPSLSSADARLIDSTLRSQKK